MKSPKITFNPIPKDIGDYLAYSEESSTGLVNKVSRHYLAKKGEESGCLNDEGSFIFSFNNKKYLNHRVIYFLCTGIDPEENQVDHIDTNPSNNKISNLRLATNKQNSTNRNKQKNNTSGVTGVHWKKARNKYYAEIKRNGKNICLGSFSKSDRDKAIAVRIVAETDPRFRDQEYRHPHNDKHSLSRKMLVWAKQYLEDRIERLGWVDNYNLQ